MQGLKPIYLAPARERAASELRKAIISQTLKEGEILTLESVAALLQISVTPVREAFQILARDGLIELRHNKGAVVLGVTEKYIREHYQLRAVLESFTAAEAAREGTDISGLEDVYRISEEAEHRGQFSGYADYNHAFHHEIWRTSGNEKLVGMLSELWNGLSMGNVVTVDQYAKVSRKEHGEILEAIRKHDVKLAHERMEKHIYRSMQDMLTHYH
ncbi:GntR family transcriptional regulator [Clostridium sp. AN503]|uniref:GntR family transcriptional regulator n=1 Tax=Clostridium sp. AN503 TaxID=3160598 RepID=UPI0034598845